MPDDLTPAEREARQLLLYWDSGALRVKTLTGRDERGVAQLEPFELRDGEYGRGAEFIEVTAYDSLADRLREVEEERQAHSNEAMDQAVRADTAERELHTERTRSDLVPASRLQAAERTVEQLREALREYVYGGIGRWLEPDIAPLIDVLPMNDRGPP